MKIAYAILAHRNPRQVARLVSALSGNGADFCIHIDRGVPREPFQQALQTFGGVRFVEQRVRTRLFSYRMIEATLQCYRLAIQLDADVVVLLSGQGYPLRPPIEIQNFFENHTGQQFIDHRPVAPGLWQERVDHLYFNTVRPILLQRLLNKAAQRLPSRRLDFPVYGGSAWLSITAPLARHLIETLGSATRFSKAFRFAHNPDEHAIQSVAMNSGFASSIINDNLHHIRWQPAATHPDIFADSDFDELAQSGKLFARKFDLDAGPALLDRIDRELLHRVTS